MRQNFLVLLSLLTLAILAAMPACTRRFQTASDNNEEGSVVATVAADPDGSGIDSLPLRAMLVSATRAYSFAMEGEQYYYTISVSAEWPLKIGDFSLKALQDTLLAAACPKCDNGDLEQTLTDYLLDTVGIVSGPAETIAPGDVPVADSNVWTLATHIERIALTPRYVSYFITSSSYLGGAHPNTAVTPVTYDLKAGRPVTASTLFVPGSEEKLLSVITGNLADAEGCNPDHLTSAGFFTDTLPMPSGMYLDSSGMIIFQYGQYEIAPYSKGIIHVSVAPSQVLTILTPEAASLLAQ